MTRLQKVFVFVAVTMMLAGSAPVAHGQLKFFLWFRERIGERPAKEPDRRKDNEEWQKKHFASPAAQKTFIAAVKKSTCYTCHERGKKKEDRNAFGTHLSESIQAQLKMDSKSISAALRTTAPPAVQQKVQDALYGSLDKVLKLPADPQNSNSDTYGDRIKRGELPVSS